MQNMLFKINVIICHKVSLMSKMIWHIKQRKILEQGALNAGFLAVYKFKITQWPCHAWPGKPTLSVRLRLLLSDIIVFKSYCLR